MAVKTYTTPGPSTVAWDFGNVKGVSGVDSANQAHGTIGSAKATAAPDLTRAQNEQQLALMARGQGAGDPGMHGWSSNARLTRKGDDYLRSLVGLDPLQAYQAETQRTALTGLMGAFQGMAGGAGAAPGLNISGPSGPIASVNYQTSINPQQQVYNPQPGMQQMQAAPPQAAGQGGQAFANNYAGMAQANANTMSRGATQGQANYNLAATQAQQQGALAGLGQQNRAANNRSQRKSRMFGMGTNMMSGLLR